LELLKTHPATERARLIATAAAFGALTLAYYWVFGGSAWHPTDYEQVPAFVYRLSYGEVPYRDFIYHKPPGTLFLHLLWRILPDSWEIRASRFGFYVQMFGATLMPILWALKRAQVSFGWRLLGLGCATTAIALHNFPIMSWQTSDGIFFCSLGWVALLESTLSTGKRLLWCRGIASFALAFGLLCKQSFILSCVAFALFITADAIVALIRKTSVKEVALRVAASGGPALGLLGAVVLWLKAVGAWEDFLAQFTSQSTGSAFLFFLTRLYSDPSGAWVVATWALVPALRLVDGPGVRGWAARALALWPLAMVARAVLELIGDPPMRLGPMLTTMLVGILLGQCIVGALMYLFAKGDPSTPNPRLTLITVGALAAALSCQLSIGYASPILAIGWFGLVLHSLLPDEQKWTVDLLPAAALSYLAITGMWAFNERSPYRDAPRSEHTRDLGEVFPYLSGIHTTPANVERYAALKQILTEKVLPTGRRFAVLQDYPGIHMFLGTRNPIGIDWDYPPDSAGFDQRLINELEKSQAIAVIPKESDATWARPTFAIDTPCEQMSYPYHAPASQYVLRNWRLFDQNRFFCLFSR
jgi:hypothetical protein